MGFGLSFVNSVVGPSSDSNLRPVATATITRPRGQRAELPDVTTFVPLDVANGPSADFVGRAGPQRVSGSTTDLSAETQHLGAIVTLPAAQFRRSTRVRLVPKRKRGKWIPANLVIYSAASMMVGVSAPGMTPLARRYKALARRTLSGRESANVSIRIRRVGTAHRSAVAHSGGRCPRYPLTRYEGPP